MVGMGTPLPVLPPRPGLTTMAVRMAQRPPEREGGQGVARPPEGHWPYWGHLRTELSPGEARGPVIAFPAPGKTMVSF